MLNSICMTKMELKTFETTHCIINNRKSGTLFATIASIKASKCKSDLNQFLSPFHLQLLLRASIYFAFRACSTMTPTPPMSSTSLAILIAVPLLMMVQVDPVLGDEASKVSAAS